MLLKLQHMIILLLFVTSRFLPARQDLPFIFDRWMPDSFKIEEISTEMYSIMQKHLMKSPIQLHKRKVRFLEIIGEKVFITLM